MLCYAMLCYARYTSSGSTAYVPLGAWREEIPLIRSLRNAVSCFEREPAT